MSTIQSLALRNTAERHEHGCQENRIAKHILDADCYHEAGSFTLSFLPCTLPELFTVRFTSPADFTEGDAIIIKNRRFTVKTRTMEEPAGKLFSAGAVMQCDIDMERNLAFITPGGEAQGDSVNLGSALPEMNGTASPGSSTSVSREDHIHPIDTSRAPLDSPALTGEPTAPTPTSTSAATAIATKEYADRRIIALGSVVGATATLIGGVNVDSVTRTGAGRYQIKLRVPQESLNSFFVLGNVYANGFLNIDDPIDVDTVGINTSNTSNAYADMNFSFIVIHR